MNYLAPCLIILILILIVVIFFNKSTFIDQIVNQNYNSTGCTRENRSFPSGHLPGSYLGLTKAEQANILKKFIENNPNLT
jgi:hypothetical protein